MTAVFPRQQPCEYQQPEQPRELLLLLCFTVFWSVLNGTMFNVAVPDIAGEFRLTAAAVSWVVTGYIAVFALAATTYGKLADHYPVRRLMTIGLLLFNFGALLSLVAPWYPLLVAGRLVQAAGGGAIPALVMISATRYARVEQRGQVLGAVGATVAVGMGLGPLVGGLLAGFFHWRWLFLLSFATLLVILPLRRTLPTESSRPGEFDLAGALLLAAGMTLFLLVLTGHSAWLLLPVPLLGSWLKAHLSRSPTPFLPQRLLGEALFRRALLVTCLSLGAMFGLLFAVPLLLRQLFALETISIGLVIFPGALFAALAGLIGGRLVDRLGVYPIALAGQGCLAVSLLLLGALGNRSPLLVTLILVFSYAGFALLQPALGKTVSLVLPAEQVGICMGIYNLTYFLSGAVGTALAGGLISLLGAAPVRAFATVFAGAALGPLASMVVFRQSFARLETDKVKVEN
ncbi:MAG TPA: MFS transporter [Geothermobacteraceae bacterium]|nr:MFS transporter [Geothermobacteraceae bacterium]